MASQKTNRRVALVQMPWASIAQPSIALGILKQIALADGFEVDVHYLNVEFASIVGFELYESISVRSALDPEWFFSTALFGPNGLGLIDNTWADLLTTEEGRETAERLTALTGSAEACQNIAAEAIPFFIERCLTRTEWGKYDLIGFSTTFAQTMSSLLLSKHLKENHPHSRIVFGGANVDAEMGFELIKAFGWIDYVVHGEGEESFRQLLKNVTAGREFEVTPGVSIRKGEEVTAGYSNCLTLANLNESPIPDYADYFVEAERTGLDRAVKVQIPFESARGCWWGAKFHCTFCGLNRDTMAFRKKSPERVFDELMNLASTYRCLTFNATDNIIDMSYFNELLPRLADAEVDFQIFYEVKANLRKQQIERLARAGVAQIQPGIESLNSEILRLMQKGVTAIQNIQLLKWCFEYDIEASWNILYGFPGEQPEQYDDLPHTMRSLFHLQPPTGITPVIFERFSPYHFAAPKYGLKLTPFKIYRTLYPEQLINYEKVAYYFDGDWNQKTDPQEYIQPAIQAYANWVSHWLKNEVMFYYEQGPGFLTLHDNRPFFGDGELQGRKIVLNDIQAKIYRFCDGIQSLDAIRKLSSDRLSEAELTSLLDDFVEHGLMYRENNQYLALAVKCRTAFRQRQSERSDA